MSGSERAQAVCTLDYNFSLDDCVAAPPCLAENTSRCGPSRSGSSRSGSSGNGSSGNGSSGNGSSPSESPVDVLEEKFSGSCSAGGSALRRTNVELRALCRTRTLASTLAEVQADESRLAVPPGSQEPVSSEEENAVKTEASLMVGLQNPAHKVPESENERIVGSEEAPPEFRPGVLPHLRALDI